MDNILQKEIFELHSLLIEVGLAKLVTHKAKLAPQGLSNEKRTLSVPFSLLTHKINTFKTDISTEYVLQDFFSRYQTGIYNFTDPIHAQITRQEKHIVCTIHKTQLKNLIEGDTHRIEQLQNIHNAYYKRDLVKCLPKEHDYAIHRKMLRLFIPEGEIDNFYLAKVIHPKITKIDFNSKRKYLLQEVNSRIQTMKKYINQKGFTIRSIRSKDKKQLIAIKKILVSQNLASYTLSKRNSFYKI